jgi:salicylate hydroxylase
MKIAIAGAGLGGLTAALALIARGHQVHVYEQASALGEIGAGVQMSANATKVMRALGLIEALAPQAVLPKTFEFLRYDTGELLHTVPLGPAHEAKHGSPYFQLHRADLHRVLSQAFEARAPGRVSLNKKVAHVEEFANGARLVFADGSAAEADLVVGADGIKSAVRRFVIGEDQPVFTGLLAWRLIVPTADIPEALRTDTVSSIWCGPQNHAVMYYLRGGALTNFVGCVEGAHEEESWTVARPWEELSAAYAGWHPKVRALIEAADRGQCFRWALNNRPPQTVWSASSVVLIGDAVHATLPFMAQGAAMAIEDAFTLARALELPLPMKAQLAAFAAHRAPRTSQVVTESNEMGALYHIMDAAQMREAFHTRNIAKTRNEWLYPYDPLTADLTRAAPVPA